MTPHLDNARLIVISGLLVFVAAFLVYEVWAWATHGRDATISSLLDEWSSEWPVIVLGLGLLVGHACGDKKRLGVLLWGIAFAAIFWSGKG